MADFLRKLLAFFATNRKLILVLAAAIMFVLFGLWSRTQFSIGIFQPFAAEVTPTPRATPPNGPPHLLPRAE